MFIFMGITKPCTHLHPAPSTFAQLHPPPPSSFQPPPGSIHLHPAHFSLHPGLCNTLNNIWTKILHVIGQFPQIYAEKLKVKSCSFWLKIDSRGILELLIPHQDLDFWNSDPKIHFRPNLGPKIQSCSFCLKIGAHSILRMLIPNPDLDFWNFDPKVHFCGNLGPKIQSCSFCMKIAVQSISRMLIPNLDLDFWNFDPRGQFLYKFWPKNSKLFAENWCT